MTTLLEAVQAVLSDGFKITTLFALLLLWRKHQSSKRMRSDIEAIKQAVGVIECAEKNDLLPSMVRKSWISSWAGKSYVQHADAYTAKELTTYLKKGKRKMKKDILSGKKKFLAFIIAVLINGLNDVLGLGLSGDTLETATYIGGGFIVIEGVLDVIRALSNHLLSKNKGDVSAYDAKALDAVRASAEDA